MDLGERVRRAIADIEGWDLVRLAEDMERKAAKYGHRIRPCVSCDREPVYAVHHLDVVRCDLCQAEAA